MKIPTLGNWSPRQTVISVVAGMSGALIIGGGTAVAINSRHVSAPVDPPAIVTTTPEATVSATPVATPDVAAPAAVVPDATPAPTPVPTVAPQAATPEVVQPPTPEVRPAAPNPTPCTADNYCMGRQPTPAP